MSSVPLYFPPAPLSVSYFCHVYLNSSLEAGTRLDFWYRIQAESPESQSASKVHSEAVQGNFAFNTCCLKFRPFLLVSKVNSV